MGLGRKAVDLPPSHLGEKIDKLTEENTKLMSEIEALKTKPMVDQLNEFESKVKSSELEIELLNKTNDEKDKKIKKLEEQLKALTASNIELRESNKKLNSQCAELRTMNSDLLENMAQKEVDFSKDSKANQEEINDLKLKIEECITSGFI
ncbi:unnamed protein product [Ambrosiozyma monospora]|uniref:Unnamed protein product n=1 Tax=Ambrosiozyma monospora TaxID=43982 RepID=A0ACB5UC72_AMBMO|nr:unnamed protein product [Ambrosiozyma monospora]